MTSITVGYLELDHFEISRRPPVARTHYIYVLPYSLVTTVVRSALRRAANSNGRNELDPCTRTRRSAGVRSARERGAWWVVVAERISVLF